MPFSLRHRQILFTLVVVAAAVAVGLVTFDWYRDRYGGEPYGAPFRLVADNGDPVTEEAFRGQPSILFFGFTHCPEVCPTTLFEIDNWLRTIAPAGAGIKAWFVTVDPERDTPEIMRDYVANVSDRITGITGDPDDIAQMLRDFGIYARKVELDDNDYTMDHTATVILLDSGGSLFGTIAYGENPQTATEKLRRLAKS